MLLLKVQFLLEKIRFRAFRSKKTDLINVAKKLTIVTIELSKYFYEWNKTISADDEILATFTRKFSTLLTSLFMKTN